MNGSVVNSSVKKHWYVKNKCLTNLMKCYLFYKFVKHCFINLKKNLVQNWKN